MVNTPGQAHHDARSDRERAIFLQMEQTWIDAAERWEARNKDHQAALDNWFLVLRAGCGK
jgi:hypothetical protein